MTLEIQLASLLLLPRLSNSLLNVWDVQKLTEMLEPVGGAK